VAVHDHAHVFANQARRAGVKAVHVSVDDENISEREFAVPGTQTQSLEMRDWTSRLQRLPLDQRQVVLLVGLEE